MATIAAAHIMPMAMVWLADLPSLSWIFLPNRPLMTAPTNGNSGSSHSQETAEVCCSVAVKVSRMAG
jgi:hypothetical protein